MIFECATAKMAGKSWDLLHRSCWVTLLRTSPRMEIPRTFLNVALYPLHKVEKIQEDSWIQYHHLQWKFKLLALFVVKSLLTRHGNFLPLHVKQSFPHIIWIFTVGKGDGIESRLPFDMYSTLPILWLTLDLYLKLFLLKWQHTQLHDTHFFQNCGHFQYNSCWLLISSKWPQFWNNSGSS